MPTRITPILCAGLLVLLLAGCGGDRRRAETEATEPATQPSPNAVHTSGSSQPSPTGPVRVARVTDPARRAYVTRVDAICNRIDPERATERERVGSSPDSAEAAAAYGETIALGWRELRQIEAVAAPPGERALLKANVFDPIRSQLALRVRIRDALAATDVPRLRQLRNELDGSATALTEFARGYGFRVCGEA